MAWHRSFAGINVGVVEDRLFTQQCEPGQVPDVAGNGALRDLYQEGRARLSR